VEIQELLAADLAAILRAAPWPFRVDAGPVDRPSPGPCVHCGQQPERVHVSYFDKRVTRGRTFREYDGCAGCAFKLLRQLASIHRLERPVTDHVDVEVAG
jgi:hypothetical protein